MSDYPTIALSKLRKGTEVLRTGGGTELTPKECSELLLYIEEKEQMIDNLLDSLPVDYDDMFPEE